MTTNQNLDIIYYKRETIVIIPILNIYWQDIFIVRLSHDLCVTHVSQSMEALRGVRGGHTLQSKFVNQFPYKEVFVVSNSSLNLNIKNYSV